MWRGTHGLSAADADLHLGFWQVFRRKDEFQFAALSRPQVNPLESAQAANRRILFHLTTDVDLNYFVALAQGCVLYRCVDFGAGRGALRAQARIRKGRIAQPEAER